MELNVKTGIVKSEVKVSQNVSKKTGNNYYRLDVILPNGFTKSMFLSDSELYLFNDFIIEK